METNEVKKDLATRQTVSDFILNRHPELLHLKELLLKLACEAYDKGYEQAAQEAAEEAAGESLQGGEPCPEG